MTLSTTTNRVSFNGDGSTTEFPFSFKFLDKDDIAVVLRDSSGNETTLTRTTHYTLTDPGDSGTVTMLTAPASGQTLIVYREVDLTQGYDPVEGGSFPVDPAEAAWDKAMMALQQLEENLGRALQLPISSQYSNLKLPDPSALKLMRWNSGANALENVNVESLGALSVTDFIKTLLDDPDQRSARVTLGDFEYLADATETDQGAIGNGRSIKDLVDLIGTSKFAVIKLTHSGTGDKTIYTLNTSEMIPSNIMLIIEHGAFLDGAGTLTIKGPFKAGNYKCFGSSNIISGINRLNANWFGFLPFESGANNATNWALINTAANYTAGVYIPKGTYTYTGTFDFSKCKWLSGDGSELTIIDITPSSGQPHATFFPAPGAAVKKARLEKFTIKGQASAATAGEDGIVIGESGTSNAIQGIVIDDVLVKTVGGNGFKFAHAVFGGTFSSLYASYCYNYGIYIEDLGSSRVSKNTFIMPIVEDCVSGVYVGSSYNNSFIDPWIESINGVGTGEALTVSSTSNTIFGLRIENPYIEWNDLSGNEVVDINDISQMKIVGGRISSSATKNDLIIVRGGAAFKIWDSQLSTSGTMTDGIHLAASRSVVDKVRFTGSGSFTNEINDQASFNKIITYDGIAFNEGQSSVRVYLSGAQTVTHNTEETLEFDTESWDVQSEFDTGAYTFTATEPGKYQVNCQVYTTEADETLLDLRIYGGASIVRRMKNRTDKENGVSVSAILRLTAADTVLAKLLVYNYTDSGNVVIDSDNDFTFLEIHKLD